MIDRPGYPSQCDTCGAPVIRGFKTPAGKQAILDLEPVEGGNVAIIDGKAVTLTKIANDSDQYPVRFVSHFSTCPDREQWKARQIR